MIHRITRPVPDGLTTLEWLEATRLTLTMKVVLRAAAEQPAFAVAPVQMHSAKIMARHGFVTLGRNQDSRLTVTLTEAGRIVSATIG